MEVGAPGTTVAARSMLVRLAVGLALATGLAGLVATLAWTLGTLGTRPLDNVEGEILFEAERIRAHLPLYVDPRVGAPYPGSLVPARYHVLYVPVWAAVLSLVPPPAAFVVARVAAALAWFGSLARAVVAAPRPQRLVTAGAALLFGGAFVLALHGASGRPDAIAVGIVGAALFRSVRRGGVDAVSAALFVLAFFVKPNAIGAAPGALLATAWLGPRRRLVAALASGLAAALGLGLALTLATGGRVWIVHLLVSTGQGPTLALWCEQLAARGPFFLAPLLASLAYGALAWRRTGEASALVASAALATSTAWCLLCLAKIGSASNYFLEPAVAAVTLLGGVPLPAAPRPSIRLPLAIAAVVQAAWVTVASIRSVSTELPVTAARVALLARARATCGAPPGALIASDEPGLELMLDGRILDTPFQLANLVRRGAFDPEIWARDLAQPEVACLVVSSDVLERDVVAPAHDRYGPAIRHALVARFAFVTDAGGFRLYRARF